MTEHINQLIIDAKVVVTKTINSKGDKHGEETFTVTLEDGSKRQMSQAELRRSEEANIEED